METTLNQHILSSLCESGYTISSFTQSLPLTMTIQANGSPVLTISPNGDITWKDKVIEGDDEFREAVIGLYKYISGGII